MNVQDQNLNDDDDLNEIEVEIVDGDEVVEQPAAKVEARTKSDEPAKQDPASSQEDDREALRADIARERARADRAERERDEAGVTSLAKVAAAEGRQAETQREAAKSMLATIDIKIKAAREAIKAAKKEGDEDTAWEAEDMLSALRRNKEKIENEVLPSIPTAEAIQQRAREAAGSRTQRTDGTPINEHTSARNQLAVQWAGANTAVMADPRLAQAVRFMSEQVASEGLRADDPAHFAELTKRMQASFPRVGVKGIGSSAPRQSSPPVAGTRTAATGTSKPGSVKLGPADFAQMRKYKMDPKNPRAQLAYAKAKKEIAAEESARGNAN